MDEIKRDSVRWIKAADSCQSPVIIHNFHLDDPRGGYIEITGLGYFALRINGSELTRDRFVPALSDYEKRDLDDLIYPISDTFTHRIYYLRYDCSGALRAGDNTVEIWLGNGFYRQTERIAEGRMEYGQALKTAFCLVCEDAGRRREICSDGTELWRESEITYSQLFIGEVQDARISEKTADLRPVDIVPSPDSELTLQTCPADRVTETISPVLLQEAGDRRIYDAGVNISGTVRFSTDAPSGTRIRLRFAENCADGELDHSSCGGDYICADGRHQIMEDLFICDGTHRSFEPRFVWHAFRYFEIDGPAVDPIVQVIHSDTPVISSFESDSEGLTWLYEAFLRTQLNNMHGGVPSDCPHRERLGYTGDGQVCAPAAMLTLDSREFYRKWIRDILDCQDVYGGHVQHTAPFMGGGGGPGGWGCAIVLVPYAYYLRYGGKEILEQCYGPMKKWCRYLDSRLEDGLIVREEDGGWCLGDWCTLDATVLPPEFVNTYFYIRCLRILRKIALLTERDSEAEALDLRRKSLERALTDAFFDGDTGDFCGNVQGANAYGLDIGLGDERTLRNMVRHYEQTGCLDTGFLGTDILFDVLFRKGQTDLAYKLLSSRKPGSFLYMKDHGATTLWEDWLGAGSHDHPMFGAAVRQLFVSILGIDQAEGTAGYADPVIHPSVPDGMQFARGSIRTENGTIAVSWRKTEETISFLISLPPGTDGVFRYGEEERIIKGGTPFEEKYTYHRLIKGGE